jgi:hypothetical protein
VSTGIACTVWAKTHAQFNEKRIQSTARQDYGRITGETNAGPRALPGT